jgi:hypothetical protein
VNGSHGSTPIIPCLGAKETKKSTIDFFLRRLMRVTQIDLAPRIAASGDLSWLLILSRAAASENITLARK